MNPLFLMAALALPPTVSMSSHPPWTRADATFFRMLLGFSSPKIYRDDGSHAATAVLLVEDDGDLTDALRRSGVKAWAMTRWPALTSWGIQGDLTFSPIAAAGIQVAALMEPLNEPWQMLEMADMVREGGFILMDIRFFPEADPMLREIGFERFPMNWNRHGIWRKQTETSA